MPGSSGASYSYSDEGPQTGGGAGRHTTTSSTDEGYGGGADDFWTTEGILARAGNASHVSAPPNASILFEPTRTFTPFVSLGPVVGMVTDCTARILIETSDDVRVKCFLTDKHGIQHGVAKQCRARRPAVCEFAELRANTYYRVTFDIPVPGLVKSGFTTMAAGWSLSKHAARIAVVSGNDFTASQDAIPHDADMWKSLYNQVNKRAIDYVFHLGNIAMVDSDQYTTDRNGRRAYTGPAGACPFQEALKYCSGLGGEALRRSEGIVCETFRNAWRETWLHPTTRHVLANAPNLMILNDREIMTGLGDEAIAGEGSAQSSVVLSFIQNCAYRVYTEYSHQLYEVVPMSNDYFDASKIGHCYHFHAFGDMGFVFLDSRVQRTLHNDFSNSDSRAFLGLRQWADLGYALAPGGYLHSCKVLMVCTASPVAHTGESAWLKGNCSSKSQRALWGTWNTSPTIGEASLLLSKLFDWKAAKPGKREVVLLGGSSTDAGMTEILDLRLKASGRTDTQRIKQVTSGPIAAADFPAKPRLSGAGSCVQGLGAYHQFTHLNVISRCNYCLVDVSRSGDTNFVTAQHVTTTTKNALKVVPHASNLTAARGCWGNRPDDRHMSASYAHANRRQTTADTASARRSSDASSA